MAAKKNLRSRLALTLAVTFAAMCLPGFGQNTKASNSTPKSSKISPIPGFDTSLMDTSADPCADFYQYACGKFSEKYPIPSDLPWYNQFENVEEYNRQLLRGILEQASKAGAKRSANEQKIGDYYASCMDTAAINADGLKPLRPELDRIDALNN
ncbi:MAG: M13 family peptidase, partial [Acidobacteriaceae bacterium]